MKNFDNTQRLLELWRPCSFWQTYSRHPYHSQKKISTILKKQQLNNFSTEYLQKKEKSIKAITGMLAITLIALFVISLYMTIRESFTPLLVVPIALLPILILNIKSINNIKKELDSRKK